jgi:tetratricopeptide (TPR) repeat protein
MKAFFLFLSILVAPALSTIAYPQCETWNGHPQQDKAEGAHSIYRQALKDKNYPLAIENWRVAIEIAPAADGRRDYHFTDGAKIYKWLYKNTDDADLKKVYQDSAMMMFDAAAQCYRNQSISVKKCTGDQACYDRKAGYIYGRKVYEMYYTFNMPRNQIFENAKKAVDLAGNETEYIVFDPMAAALVKSYEREQISAEEVRKYHGMLKQIAADHIENDETYGQYYEQSIIGANRKISKIEDEVYDCDYFLDKLLPQLEAFPDSASLIKEVYETLLDRDCDTLREEMQALKEPYEAYMVEYREKVRRELAKTNPGIAARLLYEEGKYKEAIDKYKEAIDEAKEMEDTDKLADYYFSMASIMGRKLKRYSKARSLALKAVQYRENWGQPYLLIGDLYASSKCGDAWNQRLSILAALDKYIYARSIDPDAKEAANRRIGNYRNSKPLETEGFMRGYEPGQTVKVGCWIGENVKLRFSKG